PRIERERYYSHPKLKLYTSHRVLKLHGSVNWLRYADLHEYSKRSEGELPASPPPGIVFEHLPTYWLGERPRVAVGEWPATRDWVMEPVFIPPVLEKKFQHPPFNGIWQIALETLQECETLIVIGYSFPATDFR